MYLRSSSKNFFFTFCLFRQFQERKVCEFFSVAKVGKEKSRCRFSKGGGEESWAEWSNFSSRTEELPTFPQIFPALPHSLRPFFANLTKFTKARKEGQEKGEARTEQKKNWNTPRFAVWIFSEKKRRDRLNDRSDTTLKIPSSTDTPWRPIPGRFRRKPRGRRRQTT